MSSGEFIQLSAEGYTPYLSPDVSDNELALVTAFSPAQITKLAEKEMEELKTSFRRARGVLFDTGINDHGFAMSPKALKYMESHFKRTIDTPYLHNFFKDHDFMSVEAMLGRQVKLKFNSKTEEMNYESILSNKHPLVQRAELMKSVSGTIIRGALECSGCGDPYTSGWFPEATCECKPDGKDIYPVTHKSIHIETSFVTFPAYKKTSVEMFNALQEKYKSYVSFAGVLKKEFPDPTIVDNKTEVIAQLQANGIMGTSDVELEQKKTAEDKDKQAGLMNKMESMKNISDLLNKAQDAFQRVS